jgi:hypothetical protein
MTFHPHQINGQIEINDLVSEAITNATERRNQATEVGLSDLSAEESGEVNGGLSLKLNPEILGYLIKSLTSYNTNPVEGLNGLGGLGMVR